MAPAIIIVPMTTAAIATVFSEIAMIYRVAILFAQGLSSALAERSTLRLLGQYPSVGTIALLFPFVLIVIMEGLEAL